MGEEGTAEVEWQAEGGWLVGQVVKLEMWECLGLEAEKALVVLPVGVGVREARGEGEENEKGRRTRRKIEGGEVQE